MLAVEGMGIDTDHHPDDVMDRPEGIPFYLLACFTTPFVGMGHDLEHYIGRPGDCALRTPGSPDYFASAPRAKEGFRGDWIHFRGDIVSDWIDKYDVPTNRYIHIGDPHLLTDLIQQVIQERDEHPPFHRESIEQLVERMLLTYARATRTQSSLAGLSPAERHHLTSFRDLRERLRVNLEENWTVRGMANEIGLSTSRFSALYRQFFQTSPRDDLLNMRLDLAKRRLVSSGNSISEIAEACGFASIYHFSRIFKTHIGCAPSRYGR